MFHATRLALLASFALLPACGTAGGGTPTTGASSDSSGSTGGSTESGSAGTSTSMGSGSTAGSGSTGGPMCEGVTPGECEAHEDCPSGYCESFSTAPPDPSATCMTALPEGQIRLTGTVRDWVTFDTITGADMRIAGALEASANPTSTPGIETTMSDAGGRFALETDKADGQAIGLVALTEASGYKLTVSGLVEANISDGSYPPGNTNHDVWVVGEGFLQSLNDALMSDPEAAPFLPLGDAGGVVGRVRDPSCGQGVAGVEVVSRAGAQSVAIVRYMDEQGGFTANATTSSGLFVVLSPVLAEKFDAVKDGMVVSEREATVGSAPGGIFTVTLTLLGE